MWKPLNLFLALAVSVAAFELSAVYGQSRDGVTLSSGVVVDGVTDPTPIDGVTITYGGGGGSSPGTTDLQGWWSFDDASGNLTDDHTTSADLPPSGTPTYSQTGNVGNAISFNSATPDYFESNNTVTGTNDYPFSFGGWYNSSDTDAVLMWYGQDSTASSYTVIRFDSSGNIQGIARNTTTQSITDSSTSNDSTWNFVVFVLNSATERRLYVDGTEVAGGASETSVTNNSSWDDVTFAYRGDTTPSLPYSGLLDEWFFYGKALTADNVTWLWNSGSGRDFGDL